MLIIAALLWRKWKAIAEGKSEKQAFISDASVRTLKICGAIFYFSIVIYCFLSEVGIASIVKSSIIISAVATIHPTVIGCLLTLLKLRNCNLRLTNQGQ